MVPGIVHGHKTGYNILLIYYYSSVGVRFTVVGAARRNDYNVYVRMHGGCGGTPLPFEQVYCDRAFSPNDEDTSILPLYALPRGLCLARPSVLTFRAALPACS